MYIKVFISFQEILSMKLNHNLRHPLNTSTNQNKPLVVIIIVLL